MLKTFFLSLLCITFLIGEDQKDYPFMGISLSTQNISPLLEDAAWKGGIAVKYGQQSLDWRTTFAIDYTQDTYFGANIEIDKILLDNMFGTAKLRPYLGAVVGYMSYDDKNLNIPLNPTPQEQELYKETNGFYFGGAFGFIIYATNDVDIDISYHYYKVQNLNFLDDLHGATLSLHYFF